eukprot:g76689.t1
MKDYYTALGVSKDATIRLVSAAIPCLSFRPTVRGQMSVLIEMTVAGCKASPLRPAKLSSHIKILCRHIPAMMAL